MCEVIKIGYATAIICNGKQNHVCNEDATVHGTSDGQRFYFTDKDEEKKWYDANYEKVTMGSVCCSICGSAAIDKAMYL